MKKILLIVGFMALVNSGFSQSTHQKLVKDYYRAYEQKDWNLLKSILSPGFHFSSPVDDHINLQAYHDRCWPNCRGLADVLTSLDKDLVYVGVSAGSMAASALIGETYSQPRGGSGTPLTSEDIIFTTAEGEITRNLVTAKGMGLVDFAIIPHFSNPAFSDACGDNATKWAEKLPLPVYAIDEHTAIQSVDGQVEIISEGQWKLFNNKPAKV